MMGNETNGIQVPNQDISFDWKAFMRFFLETAGEREKIGPAWFLFFDIACRADRGGVYTQTYAKLAKRYGVAIITVKKWREHLYRHSIIETFNCGYAVAFRLLEPYRSFIRINSSEEMKSQENEEFKDLLALKKLLLKAVKSGEEAVHN